MDYVGVERRLLSIIGKGYRVCIFCARGTKWWYICTNLGQQAVYLWKDGTLNGSTGYESPGFDASSSQEIEAMNKALGFWRMKEEAEAFLEEWQWSC